jgi:hypothetical protein
MIRRMGFETDEPAHDVLAAEAFAVPARDADLRAGAVRLPEDPSGIAQPHDVLAAEEFPMPAVHRGGASDGGGLGAVAARAVRPRSIGLAIGIVAAVALVVRLLRRH